MTGIKVVQSVTFMGALCQPTDRGGLGSVTLSHSDKRQEAQVNKNNYVMVGSFISKCRPVNSSLSVSGYHTEPQCNSVSLGCAQEFVFPLSTMTLPDISTYILVGFFA